MTRFGWCFRTGFFSWCYRTGVKVAFFPKGHPFTLREGSVARKVISSATAYLLAVFETSTLLASKQWHGILPNQEPCDYQKALPGRKPCKHSVALPHGFHVAATSVRNHPLLMRHEYRATLLEEPFLQRAFDEASYGCAAGSGMISSSGLGGAGTGSGTFSISGASLIGICQPPPIAR